MRNATAYSSYITSGAWRARRAKWFKAHGQWCRGCGITNAALNLHHTTYERLGAELDEDLVALCVECHDLVHRLEQLSPLTLKEATEQFISEHAEFRRRDRTVRPRAEKMATPVDNQSRRMLWEMSPGKVAPAHLQRKRLGAPRLRKESTR